MKRTDNIASQRTPEILDPKYLLHLHEVKEEGVFLQQWISSETKLNWKEKRSLILFATPGKKNCKTIIMEINCPKLVFKSERENEKQTKHCIIFWMKRNEKLNKKKTIGFFSTGKGVGWAVLLILENLDKTSIQVFFFVCLFFTPVKSIKSAWEGGWLSSLLL